MNIIVTDKDGESLDALKGVLERVFPEAHIAAYTDPMYAVKFGLRHRVDLLFTEVNMSHIDGLSLIQILRIRYPKLKAYLVTDQECYRKGAEAFRADGYLQKPAGEEALRAAVGRTKPAGEQGTEKGTEKK